MPLVGTVESESSAILSSLISLNIDRFPNFLCGHSAVFLVCCFDVLQVLSQRLKIVPVDLISLTSLLFPSLSLPPLSSLKSRHPLWLGSLGEHINSRSGSGQIPATKRNWCILGINLHVLHCLMTNNFLRSFSIN